MLSGETANGDYPEDAVKVCMHVDTAHVLFVSRALLHHAVHSSMVHCCYTVCSSTSLLIVTWCTQQLSLQHVMIYMLFACTQTCMSYNALPACAHTSNRPATRELLCDYLYAIIINRSWHVSAVRLRTPLTMMLSTKLSGTLSLLSRYSLNNFNLAYLNKSSLISLSNSQCSAQVLFAVSSDMNCAKSHILADTSQ
jgi:hypothetical protein